MTAEPAPTVAFSHHAAMLAMCLALSGPAAADLRLPPGATLTEEVNEPLARHLLPTARFTPEHRPGLPLEGHVRIRAWRLPAERADTLAVHRALRAEAEAAGYRILFECAARDCGGFDFRFAVRVLPAPAMAVDLADFRYFSARAGDTPERHLGVLVSRGRDGGYVQIAEIDPPATEDLQLVDAPEAALAPAPAGDLSTLLAHGRAVLETVSFEPGATTISDGAEDEIAALAALLGDNPEIGIVIVGHSDNTGSLEANLRVSRARAAAVRRALVAGHGVAPDRVGAEGAGFLAPRVPNDSDENRARNRRVEVILR